MSFMHVYSHLISRQIQLEKTVNLKKLKKAMENVQLNDKDDAFVFINKLSYLLNHYLHLIILIS
jgi:hypothetical protein